MNCLSQITQNIANTCETQGVGGVKVKGWLFDRKLATFIYDATNPSKITDIAIEVGAKAYTFTAEIKATRASFERVVEEGRADRFIQKIGFNLFEGTTLAMEQADRMKDLVVIYERVDSQTGGDGDFVCHGAKFGLYVESDARDENADGGARVLDLASHPTMPEPWSRYHVLKTDRATTLEMLVALETTQAP